MKLKIIFICALVCVMCGQGVFAQHRPVRHGGAVCGDPTAPCKGKENFQAWDLPFNTGKNFIIADSAYFYGIVLKSVKLKDWGDCEHPTFAESERTEIQALFDHNKVFAQNCVESGTNYYTGVPEQTALIGVYAGRTLTEAAKFLKSVKALNKFPGIRIRRMKVGINGT